MTPLPPPVSPGPTISSGCPAFTATLGLAYSGGVSATGAGGGGYVWSISSGSLPPGVSFNNGLFTGTPSTVGSYPFNVSVASNGQNATIACSDPGDFRHRSTSRATVRQAASRETLVRSLSVERGGRVGRKYLYLRDRQWKLAFRCRTDEQLHWWNTVGCRNLYVQHAGNERDNLCYRGPLFSENCTFYDFSGLRPQPVGFLPGKSIRGRLADIGIPFGDGRQGPIRISVDRAGMADGLQ